MGVPQRLVSLLDKTFSCFFIRLKTRRVAQTFLPCSHKGKFKNSKKLLVSWTVTKMVYYPLLANLSLVVKPTVCFQNPPAQLTSHKWSHFSPKRWLEVPMMTIPFLNHLMHSKSVAKLMQKCSSIHS